MKKFFLAAVFSLTAAVPLLADDATGNSVYNTANVLSDDRSRVSYAIGMMFASSLKEPGVDTDSNLVLRGLNDGLSGGATLMSQQEERDIITRFRQELANRQQKMREEISQKNKIEGEAFLTANKTNPGVVTLPDGLQYKIITDGAGETPSPQDTVTVNYRGTFINGDEFDSSAKSGHPAQFPVNRVIPGWTEAITQMKVGSKWVLFIPSELAYGPAGFGGRIEPDKTLIFEVELLSVQHPQAGPPPAPVQPLTSDIIKVPSAAEMKNGAKVEVLKPEDVQKLQQAEEQQSK
jgi:FKBP-type peptidyl-prolyl cis-trans isomerase FklB